MLAKIMDRIVSLSRPNQKESKDTEFKAPTESCGSVNGTTRVEMRERGAKPKMNHMVVTIIG